MTSTSTKMTWQRFIAVVFSLPILGFTIEHWGYSFGKTPLDFGLDSTVSTLICAGSGILAGIMFNNPNEPFSKNLGVRALSGAITGALSIWAFGGYLWIRNFPDSILKFELAIAFILAILPGFIIYKLLAKK